jgi:predicted RecB family nuclease
VTPLQNVGLFGPRDFDKNVFYVPFEAYDSSNADHAALVNVVERAEEVAANVTPGATADATRIAVRAALTSAGLTEEIEAAVARILPVVAEESESTDEVVLKPDIAGEIEVRRGVVGDDLEEADVEIDLDVEHDDAGVYLWGYLVTRRGVADSEYHSVGSPQPGSDPDGLLAKSLVSQVSDVIREAEAAGLKVRLFHYGTTERRFLEKVGGEAADLLAVATDLLEFVRGRFSSTDGFSLKALAPLGGANWRTQGLVGETSAEWIAKARAGDEQAWLELLAYNEDDVRATLMLRRYLRT